MVSRVVNELVLNEIYLISAFKSVSLSFMGLGGQFGAANSVRFQTNSVLAQFGARNYG